MVLRENPGDREIDLGRRRALAGRKLASVKVTGDETKTTERELRTGETPVKERPFGMDGGREPGRDPSRDNKSGIGSVQRREGPRTGLPALRPGEKREGTREPGPEQKRAAGEHYARGIELAKKGSSDRAVAELSRAIRFNPDESGAYVERGRLYAERGDLAQAGADFDKAIELSPENPSLYYNRGIILYNKKLYNRAIEDFSRAIALNPGDPESFNNRGSARLAAGEPDMAVRD